MLTGWVNSGLRDKLGHWRGGDSIDGCPVFLLYRWLPRCILTRVLALSLSCYNCICISGYLVHRSRGSVFQVDALAFYRIVFQVEHLLFVWLIQMDALHYLGDGSTGQRCWSAKDTLLAYRLTCCWPFKCSALHYEVVIPSG